MDYEFKFKHAGMQHDTSYTGMYIKGKYKADEVKAANLSEETLLERIKCFTEATDSVVSIVGGKFEVYSSGEMYNGLDGLDEAGLVDVMHALEVLRKYE
jgi:hypothetical protein